MVSSGPSSLRDDVSKQEFSVIQLTEDLLFDWGLTTAGFIQIYYFIQGFS
jgi:hypothetical protein